MPVVEISSLDFPGAEVYSRLTERQLRRGAEEGGLFIAESPKVIRVALGAGYEPVSLLCERRHIDGDAADIINSCGGVPVYTGGSCCRALLVTNLPGVCFAQCVANLAEALARFAKTRKGLWLLTMWLTPRTSGRYSALRRL